MGGLLLYGDGRRKPLYVIQVGLIHPPQEHTGVGREGLHIAALPLGKYSIKGKGRLPGPAQARYDYKLIPGQFDIDVLKVVLPGSFYNNFIHNTSIYIVIQSKEYPIIIIYARMPARTKKGLPNDSPDIPLNRVQDDPLMLYSPACWNMVIIVD